MSCVVGNSGLSRSSGKTRSAVETQESGGVHAWGMVGVIGLVRGGRHREGRRGWLRMGTGSSHILEAGLGTETATGKRALQISQIPLLALSVRSAMERPEERPLAE